MVVANLEDIAARGFLDDFAWTVLRSHRDLDAGILDPRERGTVDERGAHALRAVAQDHLDVPVVPAFHERRIGVESAFRADDDGAALLNLCAVVDPVRWECDAHARRADYDLGGIAPEVAGPAAHERVGPPVVRREGKRFLVDEVERAVLHDAALVSAAHDLPVRAERPRLAPRGVRGVARITLAQHLLRIPRPGHGQKRRDSCQKTLHTNRYLTKTANPLPPTTSLPSPIRMAGNVSAVNSPFFFSPSMVSEETFSS